MFDRATSNWQTSDLFQHLLHCAYYYGVVGTWGRMECDLDNTMIYNMGIALTIFSQRIQCWNQATSWNFGLWVMHGVTRILSHDNGEFYCSLGVINTSQVSFWGNRVCKFRHSVVLGMSHQALGCIHQVLGFTAKYLVCHTKYSGCHTKYSVSLGKTWFY